MGSRNEYIVEGTDLRDLWNKRDRAWQPVRWGVGVKEEKESKMTSDTSARVRCLLQRPAFRGEF